MKSKVFVHKNFSIGEVDKNIFGGFVEHIGRCVYTGIYEPGHKLADKDGFRKDVIELVKELDMPLTRYPGGNFVSGFDWKDSIGPKASRPARPDYAWFAMEPNTFGLDEFVKWCAKANTAPMYAVNLGTNTPKSAQELIEYCNFEKDSYWSDLRIKNGSRKPHNIKYWCLGNEMDGEWQIGHKTADEYGRIAHETAKMMRMVDRSIKLCVCGSSSRHMGTFGDWDYNILRHCFDSVDMLSIHAYFGNRDKNMNKFLATPEVLDKQIVDSIACCDAVAAQRKSYKKLMLALDEWNVWYRGDTRAHPETIWQVARPINEEIYDMTDVLVVAGIIQTMMDHADRLKVANIAQTVNIIAPIMTETNGRSWRQTTFFPFALMSKYGRGTSLMLDSESSEYAVDFREAGIPYVKSSVVYREEAGELVVFSINRSQDEAAELTVEFGGFKPEKVIDAVEIHNDNPDAVNTADSQPVRPEKISAKRFSLKDGKLSAKLKPFSWNMFRISAK